MYTLTTLPQGVCESLYISGKKLNILAFLDVLKWFEDDLLNRYINSIYLMKLWWFQVGVPQSGPLLFNIFIHDIELSISYAKFLLFADDLQMYSAIKSNVDCVDLQK